MDAYKTFLAPKNIALFSSVGVMSETEMRSREEILFENYAKIINIEALTMLTMASRNYVPAVENYISDLALAAKRKQAVTPGADCTVETDLITRLSALNTKIYGLIAELKAAEQEAANTESVHLRAEKYAKNVLPLMGLLRAAVDEAETITAANHWPFPTYIDLMFRL